MKVPTDTHGLIRLFEQARADRRLTGFLSVEAASAFGAFPLATDGETLVVAVPRWAPPPLYALLGRFLGRPVQPVAADGDLVLGYIARVYLSGEFPNFHTFRDADFVREENLPLLVSGKVEPLPPSVLDVPEDSVVLLDLALHSHIENLDRHEGDVKVHPGDLEVPFARDGRGVRVFGEAPGGAVRALAKVSYAYEGMEHRHGFQSVRLESLPHVLHPTELQLVTVRSGLGADFWVFDEVRTAREGEKAVLNCTYHFLNFGNRYRRTLVLHVLELSTVRRRDLLVEEGESRWSLEDFDRWFGPPET